MADTEMSETGFDVDARGSCSVCSGVHYGTGRICVYKQNFQASRLFDSKPAPEVNKDIVASGKKRVRKAKKVKAQNG